MPLTATDICNRAIQLVGDNQPPITGNAPTFDDSPAGVAAANLYPLCVGAVGRQFGWDFARKTVVLTPSGNTPSVLWTREYLYPTNGIQVWQLIPATIPDENNPLPTTFSECNTLVGSVQTKVIQTNLVAPLAVYNNNPGPEVWDTLFQMAVVRLLASCFAHALAGRPDLADSLLQSYAGFEGVAERRPD